jgi:hypothetical protein
LIMWYWYVLIFLFASAICVLEYVFVLKVS